ncbi:unnamed protein product [Adineta steineri]|nr:unnamed protein product [Adineta steineri]CAF1423320.1 unnamed protein product [Adineta steineri]CAF1563071.1 unnamed protein product [Adineta steineri]
MSKSQSKELFNKKKQRGRTKKNSIGGGGPVSTSNPTVSNTAVTKLFALQTSQGTNGLYNGEDPAVVVINHQPPVLTQAKEKRTKICCLL